MNPAMSDRNLVPSSTDAVSPSSTGDGTADAGQMLHGHVGGGGGAAAVVNDQVTFAVKRVARQVLHARIGGSALDQRGVGVDSASALAGCSVAVRLVAS